MHRSPPEMVEDRSRAPKNACLRNVSWNKLKTSKVRKITHSLSTLGFPCRSSLALWGFCYICKLIRCNQTSQQMWTRLADSTIFGTFQYRQSKIFLLLDHIGLHVSWLVRFPVLNYNS